MLVMSRAVRALAVAAVLSAVGLAGAGPAVAAPAPVPSGAPTTPPERAATIVTPAVVLVEVHWTGFLRNRTTGVRWDDRPLALMTSCSGVTISNDGYVITTGHCVDPGPYGVAPQLVEEMVRRQVEEGRIAADAVGATVADLLVSGTLEGAREGEPLERRIFLQRGTATVAATEGEATAARVVALHTALAGNIALLKMDRTNQPMAQLTNELPEDAAALVLGYPPAEPGTTVDVAAWPGTVAAGPTASPAVATEALPRPVHLQVAPGIRLEGAVVTNLDGAVIGLVTEQEPATAPGSVILANPAMLADDLEANDVTNELGKIDDDFRAGLDAYTESRFDDCIHSLDDVLAALPTHQQAQRLRQQAVALREAERGPTGETPPSPRPTRIPGWLVALGGVAGALVAGALWRRLRPPPPAPPPAPPPPTDPTHPPRSP